MRIVRTVAELRAVLAGAPRPVALVPTMGALHDGHLALVARARGLAPTVVASLFVNPAQFGEAADLAAYPRDEARDAALLTDAGVDVLFAPDVAELYPPGFATTVTVAGPAEPLEGEHRGPGHFAGVATVVTKLLVAAAPDVAVFGQKDAQQLAVVRRLVADLALPTRVEAVPTVRDADGLALSSRNARLPAADRPRALALARALRAAADAAAAGERDAGALAAAGRAELRAAGVEPEYLAVVDPDSFAPLAALDGGPALVAVAARIGGVRLIDNTLVRSAP
jgi:pantoate--beta-alanine ligase